MEKANKQKQSRLGRKNHIQPHKNRPLDGITTLTYRSSGGGGTSYNGLYGAPPPPKGVLAFSGISYMKLKYMKGLGNQ